MSGLPLCMIIFWNCMFDTILDVITVEINVNFAHQSYEMLDLFYVELYLFSN